MAANARTVRARGVAMRLLGQTPWSPTESSLPASGRQSLPSECTVGSFSIGHWIVVLAIVVLLFGAGRIPSAMRDLAQGLKAFQKGLKDDETATSDRPPIGRANV